jgi:hypothetical protein
MSIEIRLRAELRAWADELDPDAGPEVTAASLTDLHHRRLRHRAALLAVAVVVVLVAVTVPFLLGRFDHRSAPAAPNLYDLPTRGPLAHDEAFLAAAVRLPWIDESDPDLISRGLPNPPVSTRHVVWAGDVPGGKRWVLVAGENTAVPADTDPEHQTDLGAISSTAILLFSGPAGASADQLLPTVFPRGQSADVPYAVQDPDTGALLVVAAPGDTIEVSERPTFEADGTETRAWEDASGSDGVALVQGAPLRVAGPSPVRYRVFRDSLELFSLRSPDVLGANGPAPDLVLASVHGPLQSEQDAQQTAAELVGRLGLDQGDPDAIIVWQGQVPGPDDGDGPATVTVATVTAPSGAVLVNARWSRALESSSGGYGGSCNGLEQVVLPAHWPAEDRTYAFDCTVGDRQGQQAVTSFVIAAPPDSFHARLYDAAGNVMAQTDLVDGVAVLTGIVTDSPGPVAWVEAFTPDGNTQLRTPVLGG